MFHQNSLTPKLNSQTMILLTGHSGFLGTAIKNKFLQPGESLFLVGRNSDSDLKINLADEIPSFKESHYFHSVIHVMGKAHSVPKTDKEKQEFFEVNENATLNLLKGLGKLKQKPKQFVFISTVAIYNCESGSNIKEEHANSTGFEIAKASPYALSKRNAEHHIIKWCEANACNALIFRLPLIFGENAPGNLGAMECAIKKGYYFRIGSGSAQRSIVYLEDVANTIVNLTGNESGIYNLVSENKSYREIEEYFAQKHNKRIKSLPSWLVKLAAKVGDIIPGFPINTYRLTKLENSLTFDGSKWKELKGVGG